MAEIIKFNDAKLATGIASPKFPVQQAVQDMDPDLFINMLANHPEHIQRSIQKRNAILADMKIRKELEQAEREEMLKLNQKVGLLSCATVTAVAVAVALLL